MPTPNDVIAQAIAASGTINDKLISFFASQAVQNFLSKIQIAGLADGQVLKWVAADGKWENGAGGGGGGLPAWFQSGAGSPVGVVVPAQKGAWYADLTNGAFYIALGVTNADWLCVGGTTDLTQPLGWSTDGAGGFFLEALDGYLVMENNLDGSPPNWLFQVNANQGYWLRLVTVAHGSQSWHIKPDGGLEFPNGNSIYTGTASPVGVVTPNHISDIFVDADHGGVYIAVGVTSADWIAVGGAAGQDVGVSYRAGSQLWLIGLNRVLLADYAGTINPGNTGNALAFRNDDAVDGHQKLVLDLGSTGQFEWVWAEDGTTVHPGVTITPGIKANPITSGALPTVVPVTATPFQCSATRDIHLVVPVTFNPTGILTSTVLVELSPDNMTYSTLETKTLPALAALAGLVDEVSLHVPAGWYVRLTTTNAVLGTGTYY